MPVLGESHALVHPSERARTDSCRDEHPRNPPYTFDVRSIALSWLAGLILVAAYPPTGWGWVAVPAMALFLWAQTLATRPGHAWMGGLGFGVFFFGFLFPWIAELGIVALIPLLLVQAIFPMFFARALFAFRDAGPLRWLLAASGAWALFELLRLRMPFGGFGWGLLGYPMGEYGFTRDATQFIGTTGWSAIAVGMAAGLIVLVRHGEWKYLAAPAAAVLLLGAAGLAMPPDTDGDPVRVAIVQGSTPCPQERCAGERAQIYRNHLELTRAIPAGSVDLVVWPEGSSGFSVDPILDPAIAEEMGSEAERLDAVLLAGGDRPLSDTEWVNANVVFGPDGEIIGEYQKRHPVPFGEYIPLRPLFDWIPDLSRVPRDMIRGPDAVVFEQGFGRFGSVISFESSFSRYARDTINDGARLLVVATSQASYPFSNASDQLIGMTRMRSAELGVDVIHSAVTGRSTLITDGGEVGEKTGLATTELLTGTVQMRDSGRTLYTLVGDWMAWLAAGGFLWAIFDGRKPVHTEALREPVAS